VARLAPDVHEPLGDRLIFDDARHGSPLASPSEEVVAKHAVRVVKYYAETCRSR